MKRIPLRARLTLGFAAALTAVLVLVGALLYVRVASALDEQIEDGLEARAATLVDTPPREEGFRFDDGFVVMLDTGTAGQLPYDLAADDLRRARLGPLFTTRRGYRLLLASTETETTVLVVGASLDDRNAALASLLTQLLVVGALALGLSGVGGYLLAVAAARPVLERLEAGLVRERRFVADASHELRTPLATLQTELELALRRPRSAGELEAALASAREEIDRLVRLAEDLLVLARVDDGRLELRRERVSLRDLVESVERRFESRAAATGRPVEVDADELEVTVDRVRLEQALGNLVDNAIRYGAGTVRVAALHRNGTVELRVGDEGPGFPAQLLPRAFERFTRADDARGGGGTGLGLAIVDAIARAHGGTTQATNAPAGGAVVSIALPGQSIVK